MPKIDYSEGLKNPEQRGATCPYCYTDTDHYPTTEDMYEPEEVTCKGCDRKFVIWKQTVVENCSAPYKDKDDG